MPKPTTTGVGHAGLNQLIISKLYFHPRHTKKHRSSDAFLVPSTVISVPGQIFGRFPARTAAFPSAAGIFATWAAEESKYFTFVHRSGIDSNRSQPKSGNDNKLEL